MAIILECWNTSWCIVGSKPSAEPIMKKIHDSIRYRQAMVCEHYDASDCQQFNCILNGFVRLTTKETSKLHITVPSCCESTSYHWIPLTKGQKWGKGFHVMTILCHSITEWSFPCLSIRFLKRQLNSVARKVNMLQGTLGQTNIRELPTYCNEKPYTWHVYRIKRN